MGEIVDGVAKWKRNRLIVYVIAAGLAFALGVLSGTYALAQGANVPDFSSLDSLGAGGSGGSYPNLWQDTLRYNGSGPRDGFQYGSQTPGGNIPGGGSTPGVGGGGSETPGN